VALFDGFDVRGFREERIREALVVLDLLVVDA
jgi:hypothetical protein